METLEILALALMGYEIGEAVQRGDKPAIVALVFCTAVFACLRIKRLLELPK